MDKLTPEEALTELQRIQRESGDCEAAHGCADQILIELLRFYGCPEEVIQAWEQIEKWYA